MAKDYDFCSAIPSLVTVCHKDSVCMIDYKREDTLGAKDQKKI